MFDNYEFRAHMVGQIVTPIIKLTDKQKNEFNTLSARNNGDGKPLTKTELSKLNLLSEKMDNSGTIKFTDGQVKLLRKMAFLLKSGRKITNFNKYFAKGIICEKKGRDLVSKVTGLFLTDDNERRSNGWVNGLRDVKADDVIIDIKNCFSLDTFLNHGESEHQPIYDWQMDSYMDLWKINESILAYTLIDTPYHLLDSEIKSRNFHGGFMDIDGNVENLDVVKSIVYEHIFTEEGLVEFADNSRYCVLSMFDDFVPIPDSERLIMKKRQFDINRINHRNSCITKARQIMNASLKK